MGVVSSKDVILGKVRNALSKKDPKMDNRPDFSSSLYYPQEDDLAVTFAENLVATKAEFFFCESVNDFNKQLLSLILERGYKNFSALEKELVEILPKKLRLFQTISDVTKADVGMNLCECLIARSGSVLISSKQTGGRRLSIYPPVNMVIAYSSQLVLDIKDGLKRVQEKYSANFPSMLCLTTGPSRTADIEKTLVLGAHGPKELIVFLIDDSDNS